MQKDNLFLKHIKNIDWVIVAIVSLLATLGLVLIYSATLRTGNPWFFVSKQMAGFLIGIFLVLVFTSLDYRIYKVYYPYLYYLTIILLVSVLIFGKVYKGSRAWFDFKYFAFQPTEITKLLFILSLAGYLDKHSRELSNLGKLVV